MPEAPARCRWKRWCTCRSSSNRHPHPRATLGGRAAARILDGRRFPDQPRRQIPRSSSGRLAPNILTGSGRAPSRRVKLDMCKYGFDPRVPAPALKRSLTPLLQGASVVPPIRSADSLEARQ
jgi:hypothetical protein